MILISVIVPCYKMGRFIGEALESIGNQTHATWEVVIVDDCGPDDGTREVVESFADKHPTKRIVYHRHSENRGVSAARNTAMETAVGEYLAFLDPDDWWAPDYLKQQVDCFLAANETDLAYTSTLMVDADGKLIKPWEPTAQFDRDLPESLFSGNYINPSATVVRRSVISSVGGFDEAPSLQHVEDWDLWIRLALAGSVFRRSQAPAVFYRQHAGAACSNREKVRERTICLMCKHARNPRVLTEIWKRLEAGEAEAERLRIEYWKLMELHGKSFGWRLKKWVRRLLGLLSCRADVHSLGVL